MSSYILKLDRALTLLRLTRVKHLMAPDKQLELDKKIDEVIKSIDKDLGAPLFDINACFKDFNETGRV